MLWVEPVRYELNLHDVKIHKKLAGPLKILHLTDTHFSNRNKPLSRFFDRLARESVDLVVLTGDIMDCHEGVHLCKENLKKLKPRLGIFAVFGNHDYYDFNWIDDFMHNFPGQTPPRKKHDTDYFEQELKSIGVHVLRNETREVPYGGSSLLIHGLDDPTTGHANIRKTLYNYDPDKINLLLTHTVDVFLDIGEGEIDLAFSGHSHGGQVRFPIIGPIVTHTRMGKRYAAGIHNLQGAICCIGRGLCSSRYMRIRLLCRPEAKIINVLGEKS